MDAAVVIATLAGALVGVLASTLPGIHVNLLATLVLVAAPAPAAAPFLVAAFAAAPFGLALSSTFLGGPSDDAALSSLPAHALAREGRGREAVALQARGALVGLLLALPLAALLRLVLVPLAPWLARAMPWILLLIVAALVLSEPRQLPIHRRHVVVPWGRPRRVDTRTRDPHGLIAPGAKEAPMEPHWEEGPLSAVAGKLAALALILLAGALGFAAFRLGAASPLGWPASPLLPLLAGLFALPTLLPAALAPPPKLRTSLRAPRDPIRATVRAAWPGAAVSALLGLAPGVSASHAALLAPHARTPERALVRLAAVNGGGVVFTLLAWHALDKARSGALVAAGQLARPAPWSGLAPPPSILVEAALVVLAATVGFALALGASGLLVRAPGRALARGGLVLLVASVALFNGALGLAILAGAGLVGALPVRLGLRRSHAMGAILVPALLRAWGVG